MHKKILQLIQNVTAPVLQRSIFDHITFVHFLTDNLVNYKPIRPFPLSGRGLFIITEVQSKVVDAAFILNVPSC